MNRQEWEAQVHASNMNVTAKCIALVVGSFGNWTDDRSVWPSTTAIADMAGTTRDTAQKYVDAFVEQGWLTFVRTREKNVKEYALSEAVAEPFGILTKPKRGNQFTKKDGQLPNQAEPVAESSNNQLPNGAGAVVESLDTNLKEPKDMNLKEPTTRSTTADAAVETTSPNNKIKEEQMRYLVLLNPGERSDLERTAGLYEATPEQLEEAAYLLKTNKVTGESFAEKKYNALRKAGLQIDEYDW